MPNINFYARAMPYMNTKCALPTVNLIPFHPYADCTTVVILLGNRRWPCGLGMNRQFTYSGMQERHCGRGLSSTVIFTLMKGFGAK